MMIKYEKEQKDLDQEKLDMENNRTMQYLANPEQFKFSVGDVLVREDYNPWDSTWRIHKNTGDIPYRYVYVFENSLGVGYIRRMSIKGNRFVEQSMSVLEFDPKLTRFRPDSECADSILLGSDAADTIKQAHKELVRKRNQVKAMNEKLREPTETLAEVDALLARLKPGDKIWCARTATGLCADSNEEVALVTAIRLETKETNRYWHQRFDREDIQGMWILLTKPHSIDEVL